MISLRVNGVEQRFDGDPETPLLWYLRDELGFPHVKIFFGGWRKWEKAGLPIDSSEADG